MNASEAAVKLPRIQGFVPTPWRRPVKGPEQAGLRRAELAGRLTEFSGRGDTAALTLAFLLVLDAQREGETTAWLGPQEALFYPPDAAAAGIDLAALAVVRCADVRALARVADRLARSGAFGLLVLDLGDGGDVPLAFQSRLASLAQKHDTAIVLLTEKAVDAPSLGSLVTLRGHTSRRMTADNRFVCRFHAVKDKRRGPEWRHEVVCHGPPGVR
jgi:recombination protein RecA